MLRGSYYNNVNVKMALKHFNLYYYYFLMRMVVEVGEMRSDGGVINDGGGIIIEFDVGYHLSG
jgi:hypothetical protein